MPAIVDKNEMRVSILKAFERCTEQKPILKITLRDIATEANLNHATLLYYFKNKSDIIASYARYIADEYTDPSRYDQIDSSEINDALYLIFINDRENRHSRIFVQLYAIAVYDPVINDILTEIYETYRSSLRDFLQSRFQQNLDIQSDALLMMIEGILLYRMNLDFSEEEVKAMLSSITSNFNDKRI